MMTLWAISCERYLAICRSMKPKCCCSSNRKAAVSIAGIWIFAYFWSLPWCFMASFQSARFYDGSQVMICTTNITKKWHYLYVTSNVVIFFCLPLLVLIGMYSAIIRVIFLTYSPDEHPTRKQRKQAILMIIAIVVLFFICLFPIRVLVLWIIYTPQETINDLGLVAFSNILSVARIMVYINSAGNPLIYGLVSSRFRAAFKKTMKSCSSCFYRKSKKGKHGLLVQVNSKHHCQHHRVYRKNNKLAKLEKNKVEGRTAVAHV